MVSRTVRGSGGARGHEVRAALWIAPAGGSRGGRTRVAVAVMWVYRAGPPGFAVMIESVGKCGMALDDDTVRLAKGKNLAIVVTLMPDRQPQALLTWIDTDGEHLLVNTEPVRSGRRGASFPGSHPTR
jgi:hypothetical protein